MPVGSQAICFGCPLECKREWRGWRGRKGRTASETSGSCLTLHLFYALCVLIGSYCWWDKCVDKLALIYEVLGHSQCRAVTECVRGLGRDPYSTPLALWRLLLISCTFINSASLLAFIEQMCETPGNFCLWTLTCNQVFVFRGIAHASDGAHATPGAFCLMLSLRGVLRNVAALKLSPLSP